MDAHVVASVDDANTSHEGAWLSMQERGTLFGLRLLIWTTMTLGRGFVRAWLPLIVSYFMITAPGVRGYSRRYLGRLGHAAGTSVVFRHMLRFAQCLLDRIFLLRGRFEPFAFHSYGREHLRELRSRHRGAILLGAHMGSVEAMRAMSRECEFAVNVLTYRGNARKMNTVMREISSQASTRMIEIDGDDPGFVLEMKERIEAGEFVAVLGDRVGLTASAAEVEFLGGKARFPTGVYAIAAVLGCPIYLTFGLHRPPNHYDLYCEPFVDRVELPRTNRDERLRELAQTFAHRLEHYCKQYPDNWFNFYEFWSTG